MTGHVIWRITRSSLRRLFEANGPFLASGLAFDLLLYAIPLLLLIISALAHTALGSERTLAEVQATINQLLPDAAPVAVEGLSSVVAHRTVLGVTGLILFIVLSSTTFGSARFALNVVFETKRPRSFLHGKGIDILMIGAVYGLLGLTIALNSALAAIRASSQRVPLVGPFLRSGWFTVSEALGLLFVLALFYLLYRVCPSKTLCRPALIVASVTGTGLLEISRFVFDWYVGVAQGMTVVYGALGGLLFFILWLYYSSLVFLVGAAVGWAVDRHIRGESLGRES
jgi:membrane protein